MIEKVIYDYLSAAVDVPVSLEQMDKKAYIKIEKTGSRRKDRLNTATLAIQSYGESMYDAAALNETVKAIMEDAVVLNMISKVELNSDYNYTDLSRRQYRYQAVFDVIYFD